MIKNPKSIGCTTSLAGGMTLEQWDIEDDQFYANEGKSIMTRNLWASIPNLLMGFAVWLMWSVTATRIQIAHDNDPTVYHFKDFAPEIMGVSDGFRGCPGWYEHSCCSTWLDAPQADFDAWQASAQGQAVLGDVTYANADLFMKSAHFKPMIYNTNETAGSPDGFTPFLNGGGQAFGCPVDTERKLSYRELLFVVPSAAGLAGGVFRLPNSFMTPIVGGRNMVYFTSILLSIPCAWAAIALANKDVAYLQLTIAALFSGVGGGAFASSMANISPFFPKRQQGYGLGMNGGLGNLGVSVCQLILPLLFMHGTASSALGGTHISNGGWFLFPLCLASSLAAFLFMNNMPKSVHAVPDNFFEMLGRFVALEGPAYIASLVGVVVLYATRSNPAFVQPAAKIARVIILILIVCILEHLFIWFLAPAAAKVNLRSQVKIFRNKHTWWMTYLYIMTFGSFIGFSNAFPKLIVDLFDQLGDDDCIAAKLADPLRQNCDNPDAPGKGFSVAFLGAMIGSLIRPFGGLLSDKIGGARVTHYHTVLLTATTIGLGFICIAARNATTNRMAYFPPFFACFMIIFYCTGVGNGSTFRQIGVIFDKSQAPPVLGWSSAIASFGAFLIPQFFGIFIKAKTPEVAFFIFGAYYCSCIFVNFWFYFRPGAEKPC